MSEADGMDDAVEGGFRQALMVATQIAERVARARQESLRQRENEAERAAAETERRITAERTAMRAAITPVEQDRWWDTAKPDQVVEAYQAAKAWKDHDPQALAASTRIHQEVERRYGINTHDLNGDSLYLHSGIEANHAGADIREAVKEHEKAVALIAAAQAEEARSQAAVALRPEIERYQVPEDYLNSPELVEALKDARDSTGPEATAEADLNVAERVYLIERDGVNGPSIESLREEIGQNYAGAGDELFSDAEFVATAKDWHEAKALAEGGFVAKGDAGLQARYEDSEKELFNRIEAMGRDIESNVLNDDAGNLRGEAAQAHTAASVSYGSAQHREELAASLEGSASREHVHARVLAATDQGKHPREAVNAATKTPKARKTHAGAGASRDKTKGGPSR